MMARLTRFFPDATSPKSGYIMTGKQTQKEGTPMSAAEQYITDEKGNKVAVIIPLTEYQHLKEDLHDLAMVAERRDEGTISLAELKKRVM